MHQEIQSELKIKIANEEMLLLSEKAIYLPEHDSLLVADLHFGKIEHFRKNGIALPPKAARKGIEKLQKLILKMNPQKVIFLGDLFHSSYNDAWVGFHEMLAGFPDIEFHLVIGNHDIMEEEHYKAMHLCHQMEINDLLLTHEPMDVFIEGKYNICGHIHPGVRISGKGKQNLRCACFYFGVEMAIMPAFGTFTGKHVIKPVEGDRIFVVDQDFVIEMNV